MGNMVGAIMVRFVRINVLLLLRADILVTRRRFTENGENEPLKFAEIETGNRKLSLKDGFELTEGVVYSACSYFSSCYMLNHATRRRELHIV